MRILTAALGIALLFVVGCKKDYDGTQRVALDFGLIITPDTITMEQVDTAEGSIAVNYISGDKELVNINISNVPFTMTAGFSNSLDTPTFISAIRFVSHNTDTGYYNIKVTADGSKLSKSANIIIRVVPNPVNPALALVGQYTETGACSVSGAIADTVTVEADPVLFNKIKLKGLWTGNNSTIVTADIDPQAHTISIPLQIVNGAAVTGNGTYSGSQFIISYTAASTTTDNCSTVLTKL